MFFIISVGILVLSLLLPFIKYNTYLNDHVIMLIEHVCMSLIIYFFTFIFKGMFYFFSFLIMTKEKNEDFLFNWYDLKFSIGIILNYIYIFSIGIILIYINLFIWYHFYNVYLSFLSFLTLSKGEIHILF